MPKYRISGTGTQWGSLVKDIYAADEDEAVVEFEDDFWVEAFVDDEDLFISSIEVIEDDE